MNNEEKEYRIRIDHSHTRCEDIYLKESELEQEHIDILLKKFYKQYEELPEKAKLQFKLAINEV